MQPYSELANWDGSLEDVVVDSLDPPSPTDTPPLPMYSQYHSVDHQVGAYSLTLFFSVLPSLNPANSNDACKKKNSRQGSRIYYLHPPPPPPPHHHRYHHHHRTSDHPSLARFSSQVQPPFRHKNARLWPISHSIPMIPMILNPRALHHLQARPRARP